MHEMHEVIDDGLVLSVRMRLRQSIFTWQFYIYEGL